MIDGVIRIFLDSNVLISEGQTLDTPLLGSLRDLKSAKIVDVVTTDLTMAEVAKKFAASDHERIREVVRPSFQKALSKVAKLDIEITSKQELFESLFRENLKTVREFHEEQLSATILTIDDVAPNTVFKQYALQTGAFDQGAKKDQFPDAFIGECLKAASDSGNEIVIVTADKDFDQIVEQHPHISKVNGLDELLEKVAQTTIDNTKLNDWIDDNKEAINVIFEGELNNWGMYSSDIQDGEIEQTQVTTVYFDEVTGYAPFKTNGDSLVIGRACVEVLLSIHHPNWDEAMWDSEDKRLIPFENVSGEIETTLEMSFVMSVSFEDDEPKTIQQLHFMDENEFLAVEFYPPDYYN